MGAKPLTGHIVSWGAVLAIAMPTTSCDSTHESAGADAAGDGAASGIGVEVIDTLSDSGSAVDEGRISSACERDGTCETTRPLADATFDVGPDHAVIDPPDGGSCSPDDASACELPRSVCADDRWLAFFSNGRCVEGTCRWAVQYMECPAKCVSHGCTTNFTLAAPP